MLPTFLSNEFLSGRDTRLLAESGYYSTQVTIVTKWPTLHVTFTSLLKRHVKKYMLAMHPYTSINSHRKQTYRKLLNYNTQSLLPPEKRYYFISGT